MIDARVLLRVRDLSKTYDSDAGPVRAIGRIAFDVGEDELVSVVGPSGCGKTTLLRCLCGLLEPTAGSVELRGRRVAGPPADLAVVFQDYSRSLFPWMTVRRNVALPLRHRPDIEDPRAAVEAALAAVGLGRFADHHPWQLSGGMQQRVAIARALAYRPRVLLMDEPFASVDAQTRGDLEDLVLDVRRRFGTTVVLVTHDIDESVYMSDRVVVLSGPPSEVTQILDVPLPFPRDQISTKELPAFGRLRSRIYLAIKGDADARPAADHQPSQGVIA